MRIVCEWETFSSSHLLADLRSFVHSIVPNAGLEYTHYTQTHAIETSYCNLIVLFSCNPFAAYYCRIFRKSIHFVPATDSSSHAITCSVVIVLYVCFHSFDMDTSAQSTPAAATYVRKERRELRRVPNEGSGSDRQQIWTIAFRNEREIGLCFDSIPFGPPK